MSFIRPGRNNEVLLPSWVPAAGSVSTLTQTNGGLSNTFRSQVAPFYDEFYFVDTVNAYSGAFKNPHWGTYGCTVFFGGGHAACNDNTTIIAEYGASAITFKRMSKPTAWTGSEATDSTNRLNNSVANFNGTTLDNVTYFDGPDGQPGAPHTYACGDILGPSEGGGTYGSLLLIAHAAVNQANDNGAVCAHQIDFNTLTLDQSGSDRKWYRRTNNLPSAWGTTSAPWYSVHVPAQQRVYFFHDQSGSGTTMRWFDLSNNTYPAPGTGAEFDLFQSDGFDSGIVFHVPTRNILVACYPVSNTLRVQWMDVTASQPTLGGTATLSSSLAVANPWSMACWCEDNNRIIIGGVTSDDVALHHIEIPATLTNTWTVTRHAFPSGSMPNGDGAGGRTYKKFAYDKKVKSIVYMPVAQRTGDDTVWVARPAGT